MFEIAVDEKTQQEDGTCSETRLYTMSGIEKSPPFSGTRNELTGNRSASLAENRQVRKVSRGPDNP